MLHATYRLVGRLELFINYEECKSCIANPSPLSSIRYSLTMRNVNGYLDIINEFDVNSYSLTMRNVN